MYDIQLTKREMQKFLGVMIDKKLRWTDHVLYT